MCGWSLYCEGASEAYVCGACIVCVCEAYIVESGHIGNGIALFIWGVVYARCLNTCAVFVWTTYGSRMDLAHYKPLLPIIDPLFGGIDDLRLFNN